MQIALAPHQVVTPPNPTIEAIIRLTASTEIKLSNRTENSTSTGKTLISGIEPAFERYPLAVRAGGLVFTSGQRGATRGGGFGSIPVEGRSKQQGFGAVDDSEGRVAVSSWNAHSALEDTLRAAGSSTNQILRQHVWQRDKRFFPVYENIRKHWQPSPAPSSGLGVSDLVGAEGAWLGLDAIAVAHDAKAPFGPREVLAGVGHKDLPSASHYSQAVRTGPLIFTAGHIPIKTSELGKPVVKGFDDVPEEGRKLSTGRSHPDSRDGPIAAQTWFVYEELSKLIAHAGCSLSDTVLATVYLADLRDVAVFHRVHQQFFPDWKPALCITAFDEVGHRGCSIEIELTVLDPASSLKKQAVQWPGKAPFDAPAAVRVGDFVFLSGVASFDADGSPSGRDSIADEARAAFQTLSAVLKQAGGTLANLAKLTVYLRDSSDLAGFEEAARECLPPSDLPALEVVLITGPGPSVASRVQYECIAFVEQ